MTYTNTVSRPLILDGGADFVVVVKVKCAWKKFKELSSILTFKEALLKRRGKVCGSCVRMHVRIWRWRVQGQEGGQGRPGWKWLIIV